jgi:hypothetical protein
LIRTFRHRSWNASTAHFFKPEDMKLLRKSFQVIETRRAWFPPIWMIYGEKK